MSGLFKVARNRDPSIWLIFTYIVQFFTLILVMLSIFLKSIIVEDYGSSNAFQTRPQERIHNFLIPGPNRTRFSALDSSWKTLQIMQPWWVITATCFGGKAKNLKFWLWLTTVFDFFRPKRSSTESQILAHEKENSILHLNI